MFCRACGSRVGEIRGFAVEQCGVTVLPAWMGRLCLHCVYGVSQFVDMDAEGYPLREVSEADLNLFLAQTMAALAHRLGQGKSVALCEAIGGMMFVDDPEDIQCHRFATRELDGRPVCYWHGKSGAPMGFAGAPIPQRRPFVIWAASADDLRAEAERVAAATFERAAV